MSEKKGRSRPKRYQHIPNAVNLTLYTQDGGKISDSARAEAEAAIEAIARNYSLLTHVVEI